MARIDFDTLTEKARSSNPLLSLFTGVHQVRIVAQAGGSGGTASIRAQSVYLDGTQIPQMLVDLFVRHYVTSKYAHVGTTTTFPCRCASTARLWTPTAYGWCSARNYSFEFHPSFKPR